MHKHVLKLHKDSLLVLTWFTVDMIQKVYLLFNDFFPVEESVDIVCDLRVEVEDKCIHWQS
jgi:hypothetical protein